MGSGFRVWTAGEVVSASNVNNYLQEQAVMSFAGTAARSSAIASPEEGMLSYLQDTDTYQGYDGSAWVNLGTLSGASDSGLVHIETQNPSAVSAVNFNNVFNATYTNYLIIVNCSKSTALNFTLRFRVGGVDNSDAQYRQNVFRIDTIINSDVSSATATSLALGNPTADNDRVYLFVSNPFASTVTDLRGIGAIFGRTRDIALMHNVASSFDGFTIATSTGTMTGNISVYGYRKA